MCDITFTRTFIMIRVGKEFQSVVYSFAPLFFSCQYHSGDVASVRHGVGKGGGSGAAMLLLPHVPIDARKTTRGRDRASLGDM